MAELELNDNSSGRDRAFRSRVLLGKPAVPGMVNFLIKKGIIKNEQQGLYILIGIMVVAVGLAIAVPMLFGPKTPKTDPAVQKQMFEESSARIKANSIR
jgi:hypothetical protein